MISIADFANEVRRSVAQYGSCEVSRHVIESNIRPWCVSAIENTMLIFAGNRPADFKENFATFLRLVGHEHMNLDNGNLLFKKPEAR